MPKSIEEINQEFLLEYFLNDIDEAAELDWPVEPWNAPPPAPASPAQTGQEPLEAYFDPVADINALFEIKPSELTEPIPPPAAAALRNPWKPAFCRKTSAALPDPAPGGKALKPQENGKKNKPLKLISNIVFYLALIAIVAGALVFSSKSNGRTQFLGYSYFEVLSPSMQSIIPVGSLVLTAQTPAKDIQLGDIITYWRADEESITHEVIEIIENYEGSGARAFRTQGRDNPDPDPDLVDARNIIGVVKFHAAGLGSALSYIYSNIGYVFAFVGVVIVLSIALQVLLKERKKGRGEDSIQPAHTLSRRIPSV
ncbi:MAG: signal peptidase I [Oscillospiraceae bacterium]|jgi:signal peptidase|nr:signal peptidase I [Oscillospiraceae bacterium]